MTADGVDQGHEERRCPWCSASVPDADATHCPSCGAAIQQRETLAGMLIPGVTGVDPALARLGEASALEAVVQVQVNSGVPVEAMDTGFFGTVASHHSGPIVPLVNLSGPAAVEAAAVGEPSDTARDLAARLDGGEQVTEPPAEEAWRDLPPASLQEQVAGTEWDPWAPQTQGEEDAARPFDPWADQPDLWAQANGRGVQANDPWAVDGGPWSTNNPPETEPPSESDKPK